MRKSQPLVEKIKGQAVNVLDHGFVRLIDMHGSDLMVVNAARVSFGKEREEFDTVGDTALIEYLAQHNHWTPFAHPQVTFHIKAPIYVRTQLFKHKVGFVENEISRRYVDFEPDFYTPDEFRGRPKNSKQGSDGVVELSEVLKKETARHARASIKVYNDLIESGVAPEIARGYLPQNMYTEWYWTGSLSAYIRMCQQRTDPHAQSETRQYAEAIGDFINLLYPHSWRAFDNARQGS